MIKQIKNTGGDWPITNETLVNNHLKIFVNFVKSIDFYRSAMTLCLKDRQIDDRQIDEQTDKQTNRKIILRKCMYILLIVSFRRQNIIIDVRSINNLQYNFVIIKCNCKTKD